MDQARHATGEGSTAHYKRGCRCQECRDANRDYLRDWRAKRATAPRRSPGRPAGATGLARLWRDEAPLDTSSGAGAHHGRVSAAAIDRGQEALAAIDNSAARRGARLADPEAERLAAEALAGERAELLDHLERLADDADVSKWPRDGDADYRRARMIGVKIGGAVTHYTSKAREADTLEKLRKTATDAGRFRQSAEPWLTRLAEIREQLEGDDGRRIVIVGETLGDDEDQADDDEQLEGGRLALERGMRAITSLTALAARHRALTSIPYQPCHACRDAGRRGGDGRYPGAVAEIDAAGMAPAPLAVCPGCLPDYREQYGAALHVRQLAAAAPVRIYR